MRTRSDGTFVLEWSPMDYERFNRHAAFAARAHTEHAKPGAKPYRLFKSGEKVPYYGHTLWCAMMLLMEAQLPAAIREPGATALVLHDIIEDTELPLPEDVTAEERALVEGMTYHGGFDEEKTAVLQKPPLIKLLKLYDKTASMYDGCLSPRRYAEWTAFTERLADDVEKEYGALNVLPLARALIATYRAAQEAA